MAIVPFISTLSPSRLRNLRASDLPMLSAALRDPDERERLLNLISALLDGIAEPDEAEVDGVFALGAQIRGIWPRSRAEGALPKLQVNASNLAWVAFACGFVGRPYDDIYRFWESAQALASAGQAGQFARHARSQTEGVLGEMESFIGTQRWTQAH
jgi:hypothetical protein